MLTEQNGCPSLFSDPYHSLICVFCRFSFSAAFFLASGCRTFSGTSTQRALHMRIARWFAPVMITRVQQMEGKPGRDSGFDVFDVSRTYFPKPLKTIGVPTFQSKACPSKSPEGRQFALPHCLLKIETNISKLDLVPHLST